VLGAEVDHEEAEGLVDPSGYLRQMGKDGTLIVGGHQAAYPRVTRARLPDESIGEMGAISLPSIQTLGASP
jgi:hypothetical protein